MSSSEATSHPSPDSGEPVQSQRSFTIYLVSFVVLVAVGVAFWFGYRARQQDLAAALVATDNLRKQNVLITGSPADSANFFNREMTPEFVQDLSKLVHLKTLNLRRTGTTDGQLAEILPGMDLVSLILSETEITDEGLSAIRHMNRLETLIMEGTNIGDDALATIGKMKKLNELNLTRTQISDDGLKQLTGLSELVRLILDGTKITDQSVEHLASIPELKILEARETNLTPDGIRSLRKLKPGITVKK